MTIQNTYRKAVNKLPINAKKKNILMRHWKGGLTGMVIYPLAIWLALKLEFGTLMQILGTPIAYPTRWVASLLCPAGDWGCLYVALYVMLVFAAIAGFFIGIIVSAIIKRIR